MGKDKCPQQVFGQEQWKVAVENVVHAEQECKTTLVLSRNFESEKEASEAASSWRLSWEQGSHGDKIDLMTQNTEHLCSTTCGGNGGSEALKLPRGRSFVDLSKCST